jgi:isoleucyl-tRNA synthetase
MEEYRIDEIIREIQGLFLDLSRVYIKSTREKANSKDSGKVLYAVEDVYVDVIKMFSIIAPFITDKIWQDMKKEGIVKEESVHLTKWSKTEKTFINEKLEEDFRLALNIVERGLYSRDKAQIGLKWPLKKAIITGKNLKLKKEIQEFVKTQLNIKSINIVNSDNKEISVELDTVMNDELLSEGYSREISRKVQDARKKSGFVKSDIITLGLILDEETSKLFKKHKKHLMTIKERVNAKEILIEKLNLDNYDNRFEDKIKGKEIKIFFKKI